VGSNINVQAGGQLVLDRATLQGPVNSSGAQSVRICDSTATSAAPVSISLSHGFVLVGDPADDGCPSNVLAGGLSLIKNKNGVEAIGNTTPSVFASGNAGAGPFPEDTAPDISGNHP